MSPRKKNENKLHIAVLGFFVNEPNYGYDLYKYMSHDDGFNAIWRIKQSQFYALLDSFYRIGDLEIQLQTGGSYPDRKEYRLTPQGKEKFLSWVVTPVYHGREMRQVFLAKLYFALKISREDAITLIGQQKKECATWINHYTEQVVGVESLFGELIGSYRILQIEGTLEWLHMVEQKIRDK
jgi:DNA-binding PadR family transcriptional regulator